MLAGVSSGRRRRAGVYGGRWVGRLDTTLIFCYIVSVEKCVQKAGDSSRFFYFRRLLIGFRGYVETRHRRARPTATSNPKIVIPPVLSNAEGTLRPVLSAV